MAFIIYIRISQFIPARSPFAEGLCLLFWKTLEDGKD
jgi:hypothetical protein